MSKRVDGVYFALGAKVYFVIGDSSSGQTQYGGADQKG